jgi:hypothetical protein
VCCGDLHLLADEVTQQLTYLICAHILLVLCVFLCLGLLRVVGAINELNTVPALHVGALAALLPW